MNPNDGTNEDGDSGNGGSGTGTGTGSTNGGGSSGNPLPARFLELASRATASLRNPKVLRLLGFSALVLWAGVTVRKHPPARVVPPTEEAIRVNRMTGSADVFREGLLVAVPGLHEVRLVPLRDQVFRPAGTTSGGPGAYTSVEGLSIGADLALRWAVDPKALPALGAKFPERPERDLVAPAADGILHRTFAQYTVREIFSTRRREIERAVETELRASLAPHGIVVREFSFGNVDLPAEYRAGLDSLLAEELAAEKMRFTLELKEKGVKQAALESEAQKVSREKQAEAAAAEEVIAAQATAEAMKPILPWKEREIEQRRLESEAAKVTRLKQAEADAEARKIETTAEAESRRTLAEADAYRIEVTGKANTEQLEREGIAIAKNPLLIQKTLADKLSDKIQVIVAPPSAGFFAGGLLGAPQNPAVVAKSQVAQAESSEEGE